MKTILALASATVILGGCAVPAPPPSVQATSAAVPSSTAAAKPSNESLTISFPPASSSLSPEALAQLDGAARLYRDAQPTIMIVSGQADKQGEEFSNLILSARRANAVKKGLVDRGVPPARLQMIALGEAEPTTSVSPSRAVVVTWR